MQCENFIGVPTVPSPNRPRPPYRTSMFFRSPAHGGIPLYMRFRKFGGGDSWRSGPHAAEAGGMGLPPGASAGESVPEQAVPVRWRGPSRLFGREERRCGEACGMSFRPGCRAKDASVVGRFFSAAQGRAPFRVVVMENRRGKDVPELLGAAPASRFCGIAYPVRDECGAKGGTRVPFEKKRRGRIAERAGRKPEKDRKTTACDGSLGWSRGATAGAIP